MKTTKKLLVSILVIIAVVLCAPMCYAAEIVDSGICGDNLTWTLDSEGQLTISGEGAMYDYADEETGECIIPPYSKTVITNDGTEFIADTFIKSIVIEEGVTYIGQYAFVALQALEYVSLPYDTLTEIGPSAFSVCTELKYIEIPNSVTTIGEMAFNECTGLESITLSENLGKIEQCTFLLCESLKEIIIPESVTSIDIAVFGLCPSIETITILNKDCELVDMFIYDGFVDEETGDITPVELNTVLRGFSNSTAETYADRWTELGYPIGFEGVDDPLSVLIYEIVDGEVIITGCQEWARGDIVIPDTIEGYPVTEIDEGTFEQEFYIEKIIIPKTVSKIYGSAFSLCTSLYFIEVDAQNEYYCNTSDGVLFNKDMTEIIAFPDGRYKVMEKYHFEYDIPYGVKKIGDYAFEGVRGVVDVNIPESVTQIGYAAFEWVGELYDITIPDSVMVIDDLAFYNCGLFDVTIPGSVKRIGWEAFSFCGSLRKVIISDGVEIIDDGAFRLCRNLKSVIIPESVTYIGSEAFGYATDDDYDNYGKVENFTIYGTPGTAAETYAKENDFIFICTHKEQTIPAVAATCTATGLTEGVKCSVCDEILTAQQEILAVAHADNNGDGKCDSCDKVLETQEEPTTFIEKVKAFFQRIIDFFKNLFK